MLDPLIEVNPVGRSLLDPKILNTKVFTSEAKFKEFEPHLDAVLTLLVQLEPHLDTVPTLLVQLEPHLDTVPTLLVQLDILMFEIDNDNGAFQIIKTEKFIIF